MLRRTNPRLKFVFRTWTKNGLLSYEEVLNAIVFHSKACISLRPSTLDEFSNVDSSTSFVLHWQGHGAALMPHGEQVVIIDTSYPTAFSIALEVIFAIMSDFATKDPSFVLFRITTDKHQLSCGNTELCLLAGGSRWKRGVRWV